LARSPPLGQAFSFSLSRSKTDLGPRWRNHGEKWLGDSVNTWWEKNAKKKWENLKFTQENHGIYGIYGIYS
jgi:hypothetical protein